MIVSDADRIAGDTGGATLPANVRAFLHMIYVCEGTDGPDGYRALYGYNPRTNPKRIFDSFDAHPRVRFWIRSGEPVQLGESFGPTETTTAAGAPQITWPTWSRYMQATGAGPRFGPEEQDLCAAYLLRDCRAYQFIVAGQIQAALVQASPVWASLPFSGAGQNPRTLAFAQSAYESAGGMIA
jgi:lysozyme